MIVFDTNVISALMQPSENMVVLAWLDRQPRQSIYITSVSILEVRYGIRILPAGRRRLDLTARFERLLSHAFDNRILPFDVEAAETAAEIAALRKMRGKAVSPPDTQIAGIVMSRNATLATRNVKDFNDLNIPLVNPWDN